MIPQMIQYSVSWEQDGKTHEQDVVTPINNYDFCNLVEQQGGKNIKIIQWKGEVVDSYLQGRSRRNFPSIQTAKRQLDLF